MSDSCNLTKVVDKHEQRSKLQQEVEVGFGYWYLDHELKRDPCFVGVRELSEATSTAAAKPLVDRTVLKSSLTRISIKEAKESTKKGQYA